MSATFVGLLNWTEQGVKNFRNSPERADAVAELAKKYGATVKAQYWTLGEYDIVVVIEAPDPETFTAFALELGSLGNVRTVSLRAFDQGEIERIIAKTG